ncbi:MAG: twin-arginine translocation signal domain-containing protein [Pseudomonadota bacterium]
MERRGFLKALGVAAGALTPAISQFPAAASSAPPRINSICDSAVKDQMQRIADGILGDAWNNEALAVFLRRTGATQDSTESVLSRKGWYDRLVVVSDGGRDVIVHSPHGFIELTALHRIAAASIFNPFKDAYR